VETPLQDQNNSVSGFNPIDPSLYRPESRSDPYDASVRNLAKARASSQYRRPLPWRSREESELIRRFAFLWFTCRDKSKPSGRDWARQLGVSHAWLQKLVREFREDESGMWELQRSEGDPRLADLIRAKEYTREMMERGLLRGPLRPRDEGQEYF
jgi:hypothetical protein